MRNILTESRFSMLAEKEKEFIIAFDNELAGIGYDFGNTIGIGYCWGNYMIIYSKTGVKNKKVAARIYIRENGIVLRLYLNSIDKHRTYVENSPVFIKDAFINEHGKCNHCKNEKDSSCRFRKTYIINNQIYEKCNGVVFEFHNPVIEKLDDYTGLLKEFYLRKNDKAKNILSAGY
jgi:hypothetical protein